MIVSPSNLSILILAGGNSSRMGQDKALMRWQGSPLLTRVCEVAQSLSSPIQILSPWPQRYETIVPKSVEQCLEQSPGKGPLWALKDGFLLSQASHSQAQWLLLLACDMPNLKAARLQTWRSHLNTLPDTCLAYVPKTQIHPGQQPRWEPLCGFYRRLGQTSLQAFLEKGGKSFQQWLGQIEAIAIPIEPQDEQMFFNCNTPNDLSASTYSIDSIP